ncbi:MAG: hypothetical protein Q9198_008157 [Flavoplaca austrocitrina]
MAQESQANDVLLDRFSEVLRRPQCLDWATKVQDLCETVWARFEKHAQDAGRYVTPMTKLLQDQVTFAIAALVIPEFRNASHTEQNPLKRRVLESTAYLQTHFAKITARDRMYYNRQQPLYLHEKEIYAQAEIQRAHALLYNGLGQEQREAVEIWLKNPPSCLSSCPKEEFIETKSDKGKKVNARTEVEDDAIYRATLLFRSSSVLDPACKPAVLE